MKNRLRWFQTFAPVGVSLALGCGLFAGEPSQPAAVDNLHNSSPEEQVTALGIDVNAAVAANTLMLAFRDRSALTRVHLLEQLDASPAAGPTAVPLLRDALYDADLVVREAALRALTQRDSIENPVLTEADVAPFQGENAELAKVHLAAKNLDTATLRELIRSGDAVVQESAFEALAADDPTGAVAVLRAEWHDKTSLYRLQTLQLFTRSAYTNSLPELQLMLWDATADQDPLVRDYANRVLKEMNSEAASQ